MSTTEGLLELDAIYHFENSPLIAAYTEQPETVQYPEAIACAATHLTSSCSWPMVRQRLSRSSMSSTGLPGTSPVSVA